MDQLSIPMLADQHVGPSAPVPNGDHELPAVPKREDEPSTIPIERVHVFGSTGLETEHLAEQPKKHRPNRRQQRQFEPVRHGLSR